MMIKIYNEEKLSISDRNNLSPSMYGLPDERKFPLNDSNHIRSAIAFFSHCDNSKKKELAKRIIKAAKIHNITISKDSEVYKALYETYNDTNSYNVILEDNPKPVDADTTDDEEDNTTQNTPNNTVDADTTDDEEDNTTQNTPNNTVSNNNNTNNTVRSDTSNDNNQSDFGNGSPEQPMDTDDGMQDSDVGDDSEPIDNDQMDTSVTDSQNNSDDQLSQANSDIQNLQQAVFSNLTEEQIRIKTNNQKQQYIDLFNDISDILKRILVINKNNNNAELFNYITDSFSDLRKMIKDALTDSFNTRSFIENQIILERFIAIYTILFQLIKKIALKQNDNKYKKTAK